MSLSWPSLQACHVSVNRDLSHSLSIDWSHFNATETALVHVCRALWSPSDCSFSDVLYLFQAGNTWFEPPHFLPQFSQQRTPWVPLLDLWWFLFSLLYQIPLHFFHLSLNLGVHSVFSLLTSCLFSVEVITLIESALISYFMTWTGYDFFP